MRKAFFFFGLLLLIGIGGVVYAHISLTAAQFDVSFTEAVSYGDVSAADGLTVTVRAQLAQHMVWDTAYTFGQQPTTKTDFDFSSKRLFFESPYWGEALILKNVYEFSVSGSGGDLLDFEEGRSSLGQEFNALTEILQDVASRTQNGERHSEGINFRDYYEFYPLGAGFPYDSNYSFYSYDGSGKKHISTMPDEEGISAAFTNYFKIPVPDELLVTVDIYKDSAGNVVQVSTSQQVPVWVSAVSAESESGVYFALQTNGIEDFSGISGGFGVYLLPTSVIQDNSGNELPTLDYNNLSTVYLLDESVSVQNLNISEDGSCLNLITSEGDVLFLTVIDLETMTEKQKLPLFHDFGDNWIMVVSYPKGLLFAQLGDARFVLAELSDDKTYQVAMSDTRSEKLLNEEPYTNSQQRWNEPLISWDGKRLALVTGASCYIPYDYDPSISYSSDTCGFTLEVYGVSGLEYAGIYVSSLDVLAEQVNYQGRCHLLDSGGLSLS